MFENFLDSLNALLLQHPHLIQAMRKLFWIKHWILMGIMGVFVYLAYSEDYKRSREKQQAAAADSEGSFLA